MREFRVLGGDTSSSCERLLAFVCLADGNFVFVLPAGIWIERFQVRIGLASAGCRTTVHC